MLAAAAAALTITVRVYDFYGLPAEQRAKALALAGETLAKANVSATWIDCSRDERTAPPPICAEKLEKGHIVLRFQHRSSRGPHILGTAIVQDGGPNVLASVYAESVAARSAQTGLPWAVILGRVTAHEIGHLLLGTNGHGPAGLMRATWDLRLRHPSEWQFTDNDAARIHFGLLRSDGELAAGRQLDE